MIVSRVLDYGFCAWFVGAVNMVEEGEYFEGCDLEGPLRCIFLCEFHPTAGPKITCQVSGFVCRALVCDRPDVYEPSIIDQFFVVSTSRMKRIKCPLKICPGC